MRIELTLYRGIYPTGEPATLEVWGNEATVRVLSSEESWSLPLAKIQFLSAQGHERRLLSFPNGWSAESRDIEAVDGVIRSLGRNRLARVVHVLESRYRWALLSVALMGLFCAWLYLYGVPAASRSIAYKLPIGVYEEISSGTWQFLEQRFLQPTELSEEEQEFYQQAFAEMVASLDSPFHYRLYLRRGKYIGANAFALPSGQIVMTDQLVEMSEHRDEILSILAHEIGHVEMRHGMSSVIRASIFFVSLTIVTGDMSGVGGLASNLPIILMDQGYSRGMEEDADNYALEFMLKRNIDPIHFVNIMQRLDPRKQGEVTNTLNYIESHPIGDKRIQPFLKASEAFREK